MAAIEFPNQPSRDAIYRAYEEGFRFIGSADDGHRPHLGASLLGHECDRYLWYTFRWAESERFDGRMLRLFETGHLAEPRLAAALRAAGVELHTTDPGGNQWRISFSAGHCGGSMDGAGLGFPEGPKTWAIWECKTSGTKAFEKVKADGVKAGKPQHHSQMQVYMGETGMTRGLYTMVCKETDEVYTEWVRFDDVEYARLKTRGERIVASPTPPAKLSEKATWYQCKFCKFHEICHGEAAPEVNCRTCAHATPEMHTEPNADGTGRWTCAGAGPIRGACAPDGSIPVRSQRQGCGGHRYIPLVLANFAKPVDFIDGDVVYELTSGGTIANGDKPGMLSSEEIRGCENKQFLKDLTDVKLMGFNSAKIVKEQKHG